MSDVPANDYLLFVGNPGAGKSTLLNSLIGKPQFESGLSTGTGLTTILQWYLHNDGVNYGDTPGLSDTKKRKQAAAEITKALKANGRYRLVFVCTLEAGRVRPDDVTTIKMVLEAINDEAFPYGIVINKMSSKLLDKYTGKTEVRQAINTCLNLDHRPTPYIFTYPFNEALNDAENEVAKPPHPEFLHFLRDLPAKILPPEQVKAVDFETYDEKKLKYEKEIEELRKDVKKMEIEAERQKHLFKLGMAGIGAVSDAFVIYHKFKK